MSDYLMRGFSAQLSATMDSVVRRAMFEIMKIFENSLHDHQLELAQKGEEIVELKIKLQRAELRLKELDTEMTKTPTSEKRREPEAVLNTSEQTSDVPEIDFEVPDDWCAPVGYETMPKQNDGMCPSVRLRRLSIPLHPISIIKQEAISREIDAHQQTAGSRKSRRGSSLDKRLRHTQNISLNVCDQETRPRLRNDMRKLLQNIKEDCTDLKDGTDLRRGGRNSTGKEQENKLQSKRGERKITATESKSTEQEMVRKDGEKRYTCRFCDKVFDTPFGRSVHVRTHKRCQGCKKDFPFPSALRYHKPLCAKLKKLLAKRAQSTDSPKSQTCEEEKLTAPSEKQVIIQKESTPSSRTLSDSSVKNEEPTKRYSCKYCKKQYRSRCRRNDHMRVHTGEKPFSCSMCPKKFRVKQSLKNHMMRMHKEQKDSSETDGDLAWTRPLEMTEDNQEHSNSPRKDTSPDRGQSLRWRTMGTYSSNGFTCLLCQKLVKNKYLLMKHFHTHARENPTKCDKFPSHGQLSTHSKKYHHSMIQCEKCEKKFPSQAVYNKHLFKYHKTFPLSCKVCGKGFFFQGRLKNHMERLHK